MTTTPDTCLHCGDWLTSDQDVLVDSTGGDVCGVASADTYPNVNLPHETRASK